MTARSHDTGETRRASCHCGTVVLEAYLPQGLGSAQRCNCSFCRRRGAAAVTARTDRVRVIQGAGALTLYTWGTHTAQHYFCRICGIYTHHQRRKDPAETGINLGCIDNVLPQDLEPIPTADGRTNPLA